MQYMHTVPSLYYEAGFCILKQKNIDFETIHLSSNKELKGYNDDKSVIRKTTTDLVTTRMIQFEYNNERIAKESTVIRKL